MSQSPKNNTNSLELWSLKLSDPPAQSLVDQSLKAFHAILARQEIGFTRLAARGDVAIDARAKEIARVSQHMVVIGMGGSSLGTRALLSAVPGGLGRGKVSFLDKIQTCSTTYNIQYIMIEYTL